MAFVQLLQEVKEEFPDIQTVTTDGHTGIAKYMRENEGGVRHCLDVWHWVKNFKKGLHRNCTRKVTISNKLSREYLNPVGHIDIVINDYI